MRLKIRNRRLIRLGARLSVASARLLFCTLRIRYHFLPNTTPYEDACSERYIYSVWHDQLLLPTFAGKPSRGAALVSRHHDGSFLAYALEALGIRTIRGSSSRGGAEATRRLLEVLRDDHMVLTPDGPRGPRRQIKPGLVYLASRSGRKIVPIASRCSRCWVIRGRWTDLIVPKPFSTLDVYTAPPIAVPPDLDRNTLTAEVARVQAAIDALHERVEAGNPRGEADPSQTGNAGCSASAIEAGCDEAPPDERPSRAA